MNNMDNIDNSAMSLKKMMTAKEILRLNILELRRTASQLEKALEAIPDDLTPEQERGLMTLIELGME